MAARNPPFAFFSPAGSRAAVLLAPRISRGHFFLAVSFRVTHDGLSERGTTRSLGKISSSVNPVQVAMKLSLLNENSSQFFFSGTIRQWDWHEPKELLRWRLTLTRKKRGWKVLFVVLVIGNSAVEVSLKLASWCTAQILSGGGYALSAVVHFYIESGAGVIRVKVRGGGGWDWPWEGL